MTDAPTLEPLADGTGFRVRVRFGKERRRIRITTIDRELATRRAVELIALGARLGDQPAGLAASLLEQAGAADGPGLAKIKAAIDKLASGAVRVRKREENPREVWTMRELGEAWTKGTLAKEYPDQIKARKSASDDASRLEAHVYPVIGERRVRDVTLADCERVMRELKGERRRKLSANTRRNVALTLSRLLTLAAYPLKIIPLNPLPRGFLPRTGKAKALGYLYPDEDRALMACATIPIRERLFWGFLIREGCRVSEALGLRWGDLDLERGAVRLDQNKTDDPRAWALSPGVAAALTRFQAEPGDLVFDPPREPERLATMLRARLREAGVKRTELFESGPARMAIRAHDLRASFVTIALANGRSEAWVTDRTGHRSASMVAKYKRAARAASELSLGDWTPLDVAVKPRRPVPSARRGGRPAGTAAGTD